MAIGSSGMRTVHGDVGVELGLSRGGDGGHGSSESSDGAAEPAEKKPRIHPPA